MPWYTPLFQWLSGLFFTKTADISIVGLQASGKTSFVNVIGSGQWSEEVVPTVGFNVRNVRKGNITLKIWDIAGALTRQFQPIRSLGLSLSTGQPKFRSTWERYCSGVDVIIFIVDSHDKEKFDAARFELHQLLSYQTLAAVPLLVLGNKNDLQDHATVNELIKALELDKIRSRAVSCYSCSMKSQHNLDIVLQWLTKHSH
ncbi:P-loop containing nucleoside triphosphate hydrolase protein [Thelephora terrestris]|uniref:P-loop containing nucleoside triphosphate hydrolase protein n=1 Tax=Thelephora terrestris TaxID=56493 RepID=A0A9P6H4B7_9AGAM|nr:P-loop containing nucleoside triphosphate hydrolase protein [Thelephora terrestris]